MKKIGIIAGVLALGAIGAYALVPTFFPNTVTFPRVPVGSGTIGEMIGRLVGNSDLANYLGDGTVNNTKSLSWVSATGYLQSNNCTGTNTWRGIDLQGKAICASRVNILSQYGTVSDQKCPATIYKTDGTTVMSSSGYVLKGGDIVKTPVGCDLTIAFADYSTLHLDEDTTVSLDMGSFPDNTTIATAILEGGQIWGRILTETWVYNVGTRDIVAAVRGTSIAVSKTGGTIEIMQMADAGASTLKWNISRSFGVGPNGTKLAVIDSTLPIASAKIHCEMGLSQKTVVNLDMKPGDVYDMPLGTHICPTTLTTKTTDQLYAENRWIASNTLKDLDYMSGVLQKTSLPTSKVGKITNEYNLSFPFSIIEKNAICEPGKKLWEYLIWKNLDTNPCQDSIAHIDYTKLSRKLLTASWELEPALDYLDTNNILQDDGHFTTDIAWKWKQKITDIIAFAGAGVDSLDFRTHLLGKISADYYTYINVKWPWFLNTLSSGWDDWEYPSGIYYVYSGWIIPNIIPTTDGLNISSIWHFIAYPLSELPDLRGKTIKITLSTTPIAAWPAKKYILDLWSIKYFVANGSNIYKDSSTTPPIWTSSSTISITIPTSTIPRKFIIWNNDAPAHTMPIGTYIKSIEIR